MQTCLEQTTSHELRITSHETFAVAVSGGPDSMALLLLAKSWIEKNDGRLAALTVDHGLRPESAGEAEQVKQWCRKLGVEHHTLNIQDSGFRIQANIQEAARNARYALLAGWCKANHVPHLLTAHHRGDQAETLFFRLARGSHLRGLACMGAVSEMHGIRLVRPLLGISKKSLVDFLRAQQQPWIEDPSNRNLDYTRNAIRARLQSLADADDIEARAYAVTQALGRFRAALDKKVDAAFAQTVILSGDGIATIDSAGFAALPPEIALLVAGKLIQTLTQDDHPPRTMKLERLRNWLAVPNDKPASLGHLSFQYRKKQGIIEVFPEAPPLTQAKASPI